MFGGMPNRKSSLCHIHYNPLYNIPTTLSLFSCTSSLQTIWDESDTCRRLTDRAWDVARWKEALETCAQKVDKEMEDLTLVICPKYL